MCFASRDKIQRSLLHMRKFSVCSETLIVRAHMYLGATVLEL